MDNVSDPVVHVKQRLVPWTASGVSAFGLFFIFLTAIPGIPGLVWVTLLADHATPPLDRILKIAAWVGRVAFYVGAIAAILILVHRKRMSANENNVLLSSWNAATWLLKVRPCSKLPNHRHVS
jgi:hypothetical protein